METADLRASKNIQYRAESTGKHHKSPQKIWFKRLGARCREFESPHSDHMNEVRFSNIFIEKRTSCFLKALQLQGFFYLRSFNALVKKRKC